MWVQSIRICKRTCRRDDAYQASAPRVVLCALHVCDVCSRMCPPSVCACFVSPPVVCPCVWSSPLLLSSGVGDACLCTEYREGSTVKHRSLRRTVDRGEESAGTHRGGGCSRTITAINALQRNTRGDSRSASRRRPHSTLTQLTHALTQRQTLRRRMQLQPADAS